GVQMGRDDQFRSSARAAQVPEDVALGVDGDVIKTYLPEAPGQLLGAAPLVERRSGNRHQLQGFLDAALMVRLDVRQRALDGRRLHERFEVADEGRPGQRGRAQRQGDYKGYRKAVSRHPAHNVQGTSLHELDKLDKIY